MSLQYRFGVGNPLLSILIPALYSRRDAVEKLTSKLRRQIALCGLPPREIEVLCLIDSGELTSGQKRQRLVNATAGDHIVFIDDDDDVSDTYVSQIVEALRDRPDLITFNIKFIREDLGYTHVEIWSFDSKRDDRVNCMMAANHLCVWRTSIARQVGWCPALGYGDDQLWTQTIHRLNRYRRQIHIEGAPLYVYQFDLRITANQQLAVIDRAKEYVGQGLTLYEETRTYEVLTQHGPIDDTGNPYARIPCYDSKGIVRFYQHHTLNKIGRLELAGVS